MYILNKFHDKTMVIIIFIAIYVTFLLYYIYSRDTAYSIHHPSQELELAWTVYPAIILRGIALPSLRILYLIDDIGHPNLTVKIIGHQWYWSYSLGDKIFDSYIVSEADLNLGSPRLLEVDNRLVIPTGLDIRLLVSSADVLHSWAVPALGIKVDAVPGRLNQFRLAALVPGVYYGQCSEICGANHRFMPIAVERVGIKDWINWRVN